MAHGEFLEGLPNEKRSRRAIADVRMVSFMTSSEEVALSVWSQDKYSPSHIMVQMITNQTINFRDVRIPNF